MIVTTSLRSRPDERARALAIAERWGLTFAERSSLPRHTLCLAVTGIGLRVEHEGRPWAWHPAMLHALREAGPRHPLVRLSGATAGDRVVDCTLGLGTDARFLSEITGTRVTALEAAPAIAAWTADGLERAGADVEVVLADATTWLAAQPDRSVDVIVADPMFPPRPNDQVGTNLDPVRWLGEHRRLDTAWRDEALRVARKAVVLRSLKGDPLLGELGAPVRDARRDRITVYGAWRLDR